eukprot:TRINITY_DN11439_c0_g1_i1.p1 TRINITY_DN11439_c0_g1~~TRINITY_DN11439_c0_g1_i1.p1  ORF type:complete len:658 (-),score=91.27 TRINITY_DN11439_c0_g1_i1:61-1998(-)
MMLVVLLAFVAFASAQTDYDACDVDVDCMGTPGAVSCFYYSTSPVCAVPGEPLTVLGGRTVCADNGDCNSQVCANDDTVSFVKTCRACTTTPDIRDTECSASEDMVCVSGSCQIATCSNVLYDTANKVCIEQGAEGPQTYAFGTPVSFLNDRVVCSTDNHCSSILSSAPICKDIPPSLYSVTPGVKVCSPCDGSDINANGHSECDSATSGDEPVCFEGGCWAVGSGKCRNDTDCTTETARCEYDGTSASSCKKCDTYIVSDSAQLQCGVHGMVCNLVSSDVNQYGTCIRNDVGIPINDDTGAMVYVCDLDNDGVEFCRANHPHTLPNCIADPLFETDSWFCGCNTDEDCQVLFGERRVCDHSVYDEYDGPNNSGSGVGFYIGQCVDAGTSTSITIDGEHAVFCVDHSDCSPQAPVCKPVELTIPGTENPVGRYASVCSACSIEGTEECSLYPGTVCDHVDVSETVGNCIIPACGSSADCADPESPVCHNIGTAEAVCGNCTTGNDCYKTPDTPFCNIETGACEEGCYKDGDCPGAGHCLNNTCVECIDAYDCYSADAAFPICHDNECVMCTEDSECLDSLPIWEACHTEWEDVEGEEEPRQVVGRCVADSYNKGLQVAALILACIAVFAVILSIVLGLTANVKKE